MTGASQDGFSTRYIGSGALRYSGPRGASETGGGPDTNSNFVIQFNASQSVLTGPSVAPRAFGALACVYLGTEIHTS